MIKRVLSILFALGLLQSGGEVLAGDGVLEERDPDVPEVRMLRAAAPAEPAAAASAGTGHRLLDGEVLWIADVGGSPAAAALLTPLGSHVHGIALEQTRFASGPAALAHLLGVALEHCRELECLKVIVATPLDPQHVRSVATRHGFQFARQCESADGHSLTFYTDLYFNNPRDHRGS